MAVTPNLGSFANLAALVASFPTAPVGSMAFTGDANLPWLYAAGAPYVISGISQAASAVVTLSTVSPSNPFAVGNSIYFLSVAGMTQINGLIGTVTAIGGSSGAWTVTTNINSSAFTAYGSGGTAAITSWSSLAPPQIYGLNAAMFGSIDTTGVVACDAVLNLAITYAATNKVKLFLPSGLLSLNASLIIPRTGGGINQTFQMYGQGGSAYPSDSSSPQYPLHPYDANTVLYTNFTNAPAIAMDAGRNIVLKDFAILGQNIAPVTGSTLSTGPSVLQSQYITAGCQTGRYAPYCGIAFDPWSNSTQQTVTGITKAASAVVTVSTVSGSNPFIVGQNIAFNSVVGMTQINGTYGLVTAIGGSSGAWTATTNINSSAYTAYSSAGGAVGLPFETATITAISKAASAVVTLSLSAAQVQPFQIGQAVYFSAVAGMIQINGLSGTVTALTMAYGAVATITVNINSSAFTAYSSGGVATASDFYTTLAAQYLPVSAGDGTYGCVVENVNVMQFVVGVAIGCSGNTALAADITFRNVNVVYHDVCYAIGQSQARNLNIEYGNITNARTGVDGLNYGAGQGTPAMMLHPNMGYLYRLIALNHTIGACVLNDIYTESVNCIGQYGVGAASEGEPLLFLGGDYTFGQGSWTLNPIMLETYGPTKFVGTNMGFEVETDAFNVISRPQQPVLFDHCRFSGSSYANTAPQIGLSLDSGSGYAKLIDCWHNSGIFGGTSFGISSQLGRANSLSPFTNNVGRLNATYQTQKVWNGNTNEYQFLPILASPEVGMGNCSAITLNATTVTFTNNVGGVAAYFQVGDVLFWQMLNQGYSQSKSTIPALKITGITGTAVTCGMLFDPAQYDTAANQPGYPNAMYLAPNHWAPTAALYCIASGGTLSSVFPTTVLQNGDLITGVGFAASTTRVSAGGGTATVTVTVGVSTSATVSTVVCAGTGGQFTCASGAPATGQYVQISGTNSGNMALTPAYSNPTYYLVTASNGSTSFTLAQQNGTALVSSGTSTTGLTFTIATNIWQGRLYAPTIAAAF
jgi:hypothetical protein